MNHEIFTHETVPQSTGLVYCNHENFSTNWPKIHCSQKFYPQKIPAIRYVSLRLASLGGGPVHCMYTYMYIGSLSLYITCATLYCTKSCRDAGVILGFSLRGG